MLPDGEHVDNCQHVTFGCCTNLEDFYRRVGSAGKIKFFDRMLFLDPQGRRGEMHAGLLPAPFHMTGSFLTFAPLALKDKLAIARAFHNLFWPSLDRRAEPLIGSEGGERSSASWKSLVTEAGANSSSG